MVFIIFKVIYYMVIFYLEFKIVKCLEGMFFCRKVVYYVCCKIIDDCIGNIYDFSYCFDLFYYQILVLVFVLVYIIESLIILWNEVERVECQKDGQIVCYFDVVIFCELNNEDKIKLVLEYC